MKIVVIEDSLTVRQALIERLAEEPLLTVAGQASGSADAVATVGLCRPDVVLLDLELRKGDCGLTVLRELRARGFAGYIYVLTASEHGQVALECRANGANGFYNKGEELERLVADLRELAVAAHVDLLRPGRSFDETAKRVARPVS